MALSAQTTTAAAGSTDAHELTAEQVQRILVKPLEEGSVFLGSGVKIIDTTGPLRLPKAPGPNEITGFTGENEKIEEVDPDFGEILLLPTEMKSIKVITRFSNELARQSVVALDQVLKDRLVADVAAKVDAQFLGTGGDGKTTPKGIFGWEGTQKVAAGGPLDLDAIMEGLALLVNANVPATGLKLFIRPDDYIGIRGMKDTTGRYIMAPENTAGLSVPTLGITPVLTSRIPAGSAAIVATNQIVVARDASPTVKVLTETFGEYDQQATRVTARYDAAPLHPEAVVTFSGITEA